MIEIPCRPATPDQIPATARRLAEIAEAHGWEVATTYARGGHEYRGETKLVDSIAVRMWREGKLVAVWLDGKFDRGGSQYRRHTLTELRRMVAMTRPELEELYVALLEESAA